MSEYKTWFREDRLPHIYCTGCGNGTVINCTIDATVCNRSKTNKTRTEYCGLYR